MLLLLIPWAPALAQRAELPPGDAAYQLALAILAHPSAQRAELPPDDAAGMVWRLVHGGGGLTSPSLAERPE